MKSNLYTIYDSKSLVYSSPIAIINDATAMRAFENEVTNADSLKSQNPQDYTLFCCGEWDDERGWIEPHSPRSLANGLEVYSNRKIRADKLAELNAQIDLVKNLETDEVN